MAAGGHCTCWPWQHSGLLSTLRLSKLRSPRSIQRSPWLERNGWGKEMISSELMEAQEPVSPQPPLQWQSRQTQPLPAAQAQPGPGPVSETLLPARPSASAAATLVHGL